VVYADSCVCGLQVRTTSFTVNAYTYGLLARGTVELAAEAPDSQAFDICAVIPCIEGVGGCVVHSGRYEPAGAHAVGMHAPVRCMTGVAATSIAHLRVWCYDAVAAAAAATFAGTTVDHIDLVQPERPYSVLVCAGSASSPLCRAALAIIGPALSAARAQSATLAKL
jgi:hypothetical protein